jgi:hypothetical protein
MLCNLASLFSLCILFIFFILFVVYVVRLMLDVHSDFLGGAAVLHHLFST